MRAALDSTKPCKNACLLAATRRLILRAPLLQRDMTTGSGTHLHGLTEAALADAAQARQLETVRRDQQMLRQRHLQTRALHLLRHRVRG